jgi:C4-dicarboxylate-specific signal transduction histidine kinase
LKPWFFRPLPLALKGNQQNLLGQVKMHFTRSTLVASHAAVKKAHRRIETRTFHVIHDLGLAVEAANWAGPQSVIRV